MASGSLDAMTLGENVIIGGLVVQILFFTCFVVTAGIFHARLVRVPTGKSMQLHNPWQKGLYSLYAGSVLIWIRCVFRLIEYAQGKKMAKLYECAYWLTEYSQATTDTSSHTKRICTFSTRCSCFSSWSSSPSYIHHKSTQSSSVLAQRR
jgi:hypothetical protein